MQPPPPQPWPEKVILSSAILLVVLQFILALRTVMQHRAWLKEIACAIVGKVYMLARRSKACLRQASGESSEICEAVHQRILVCRHVAFNKFVQASSLLCFSVFAIMIVQSLSNVQWLRTRVQAIIILIGYAMLLLQQCRPCLLTSSNMHCWYCFCMVLLSALVAPGVCTPASLWYWGRVTSVVSSILSILQFHVGLATIGQGMLTATLVAHCIIADLDFADSKNVLAIAFAFFVMVVTATALLVRGLEMAIRSRLETGMLARRQSAGVALLKIFYDVLLELDTDLQIVSDPKGLDGFLLRGPGRSFQGTRLEELFAQEADRRSFEEHMRQSPSGEETLANVMHGTMRCGGDESLPVELFASAFEGPAGRLRHMVGLRRFGDEEGPSPGGGGAPAAAALAGGELLETAGPLWVRVKFCSPDLPITDCSDAFRRLMAPVGIGQSLGGMVWPAAGLVRWAQAATNMHLEGQAEELQRANSFRVELFPPDRRGIRISVACRIETGELSEMSFESEGILDWECCFVFTDAKSFNVPPPRGTDEGATATAPGEQEAECEPPVAVALQKIESL